MKTVMTVFGTRPEAIKMCPLVKELEKESDFRSICCVTGQHRQMLHQVLDIFTIQPEYDLDIMCDGQTLFDITMNVMNGMEEILMKEHPDLVLVHGDTTTAFVTGLAAFYLGIPVGHVEAGLRTYEMCAPFPEEFNRQSLDLFAEYYFAPTQQAMNNLIREGRDMEHIFVTGNTVIDALQTTVTQEYTHPLLDWAMDSKLILLTVHRRENLGGTLREILEGVKETLDEIEDIKVIYPIHLNPEIRKTAKEVFGDHPRIRMTEPLGVLDFHNFMSRAYLILTDSGGIQEEAPALGKPVLVMRNETERPEGLEAGTLRLVGNKKQGIYSEFVKLVTDQEEYETMSKAVNPYGDGTACRQIVNILMQHL